MRAVPLPLKRVVAMRSMVVIAAVCTSVGPTLVAAGTRARPIGATVDALLIIARQTSPEVAAAALDAEAARAKIVSAGALQDPIASVENENFARNSTSGQGSTLRFRVMQEIPLWGKRQLRADIAGFDATAADYRRQDALLSLETRIKSVFAARYATFVALKLNDEIRQIVSASLKTACARFAQNAATFEDVTKLEIEVADLDTEASRLPSQTVKTSAQINALLSRKVDAPLAMPIAFRRLPPARSVTMNALVERAMRLNLEVAEAEAKADGAAAARDLPDRNRYPDLSVGPEYSQENSQGRSRFGSAGVAASFSIPLQWGAKDAQVSAATAEKAAAQIRVDALRLRISGEIAGMVAEYRASSKSLAILRDHHLPEARAALASAQSQVESAAGSLADVYAAAQRLRRIRLDILKLETEQQIAIAEIEKAIGGDL